MTTVEEVARSVLADVTTDAGHVLAAQWVAERYVEMVSKVRYRHLRRLGEVVVPATQQSGTVTLTQGSRVVVPDATALAAWQTPGPLTALIGRSLRGAQTVDWYEIAAVNGTNLELVTPWQPATVAGTGYLIAARAVSLDPNVRWFGDTMVLMRTRQPIHVVPLQSLDEGAPSRDWATSWPRRVAETQRAPDGTKRVEFYPYPAQNELVHYVFWSLPLTLAFDDPLPKEIDGYVLKEGALINAMRYKASQAADKGKADVAAYWRNEYRAQETVWQNKMRDAARTDRGTDDVTFILSLWGQRGTNGMDNWDFPTTAHDLVWERWGGF